MLCPVLDLIALFMNALVETDLFYPRQCFVIIGVATRGRSFASTLACMCSEVSEM